MASNPTVTAVVQARDEASTVLDSILRHAREATNASGLAASQGLKSHADAIDTMGRRTASFASKMNEVAASAFAGFGAHAIREAVMVGGEMESIQRRTLAFTDITKRQMEEIRRQADTTLSGGPGGPQGALDAARALGMSGVRPDQIVSLIPYVQMHADETGEDVAHSGETLVGLAQMLGMVKDAAGHVISLQDASVAQATEAVRATESILISANKIAPGNLRDLVEAAKFMAPTAGGLGRDPSEMFALYTAMAEKGIRGAEAGNTIKSAESRLASPTAKARQAVATAGLNLSDYVKFNPALVDEKGIEAGLRQRLGKAVDAIHGGLQKAVDRFKAGGAPEEFQANLTDLIASSGVKSVQNRVVASNLSRDVMTPFIQTVELSRFLSDAASKGLGVGEMIAVFGKEIGGRMVAIIGDHVRQLQARYEEEFRKDNTDAARREKAESYDGRLADLKGAITGLQDRLFQPAAGPLGEAYHLGADVLRGVANASEAAREGLDGIIVAGTAVGALRTAGTLASWAAGLSTLAGAEVGPVVGALTMLAGIEFLPAVAGITALIGAVEAFKNRATILHALDLSARNDFDTPQTPADAAALAAKRDADVATIADRQRNAERMQPSDPILDDLMARRLSVLADLRTEQGDTPAVTAARDARAAAERENPKHDPELWKARDELYGVQDALKRRDAVTSRDIVALHRYIDAHHADDPNAGDTDLDGMKQRRALLRSSLPTSDATTPELDVLNGRIEHREAFNREQLDARLRAAEKLLADAKDAAGAPKVTLGDVDAARKRYEAAKRDAQAHHDAAVAAADVNLKRAQADAEATLKTRPEVVTIQRQIDDRRDYNAAHLPQDDEAERLRKEVANANAALGRYEREVDTPQRQAFAASHPLFTRPEFANGRPQMPDFAQGGMPRSGPAFSLNGPVVDLRALAAGGLPREATPQKVDVTSTVTGTVTGKGEMAGKLDITLTPGPEFAALKRKVEMLGRFTMSGGFAGHSGDTMGGINGVNQYPAGISGMPK